MWSRPARRRCSTAKNGARCRRDPTGTVRDLRDRVLIATLTYSFARINAALKMKVEDLRPQGAGWRLRLHEKGGKHHTMPCHHALAEALHAYIAAAGIGEDRKGWLFRTSRGHDATALSGQPMNQSDAWRMIRRRAVAAGIHVPVGNHTFRATGIALTLPMVARSSTRRRWRRTKARARPSSTTAPKSGSHRTRWRGQTVRNDGMLVQRQHL
jgi:integrase